MVGSASSSPSRNQLASPATEPPEMIAALAGTYGCLPGFPDSRKSTTSPGGNGTGYRVNDESSPVLISSKLTKIFHLFQRGWLGRLGLHQRQRKVAKIFPIITCRLRQTASKPLFSSIINSKSRPWFENRLIIQFSSKLHRPHSNPSFWVQGLEDLHPGKSVDPLDPRTIKDLHKRHGPFPMKLFAPISSLELSQG